MERIFAAGETEMLRYLMILARISPLMVTAPLWGSPLVPPQVRGFLAMLIAALLLPVTRQPLPPGLAATPFSLAFAAGQELLLGFIVAELALLVFAAAQFAGQLADIQVGFGIANVLDPLTSAQVTLIGQLQYLGALLVFLLLDGHHLLLRGLADTFNVAPPGQPVAALSAPLTLVIERGGRLMFILAAQISAPVLTALFLTNFALGLVARMLPQMNLFLVGMPINVAVGLFALAASFPLFVGVWRGAILALHDQFGLLLTALKAGARG